MIINAKFGVNDIVKYEYKKRNVTKLTCDVCGGIGGAYAKFGDGSTQWCECRKCEETGEISDIKVETVIEDFKIVEIHIQSINQATIDPTITYSIVNSDLNGDLKFAYRIPEENITSI